MKADENLEVSRRWRPALMAFFLRRVRDRAEAEDLTQEVFLRMLGSETNGNAARPDGYVFQVAANLLTDRARKSRVRERYREDIAGDEERGVDYLDPHAIASGRERMALFAAALEQLPERERAMFILYRFENMSQDVIGATYGISASAVKKQIAKATAFVMRKMQDPR